MTDDLAVLAQLNVDIGAAETRGDRAFLDSVIAEQFAFRRASGAVVDRPGYLAAVAESEPRLTEIESIQLYGDRAVVTCVVTLDRGGAEPVVARDRYAGAFAQPSTCHPAAARISSRVLWKRGRSSPPRSSVTTHVTTARSP